MSLNSRNKGKTGEREIINILQPLIEEAWRRVHTAGYKVGAIPILQRNLMQSDRGGYDVVGLHWLALEVKRCQAIDLKAWWQQARTQANIEQTPVLIYRRNGAKWRVMMWATIHFGEAAHTCPAEVSLEDFKIYFVRRCMYEAAMRPALH